jgi:urease accessory protein
MAGLAVAAEPVPPAPGWRAELRLGFERRGQRTLLAERRRRGPLAVQRPFYPEGGLCHVYLLHPPGGVVGGDTLDIDVGLGPGSEALVTTPGAGKFYRSAGGVAVQAQSLTVGEGASLEWLPQENILFAGARVVLDTRVRLAAGARLALSEIHCLGRPAIGEVFAEGFLDNRLSVSRGGEPLLEERLRIDAGNRARRSLSAERAVLGTLLFSGASARHLDECRSLPGRDDRDLVGATLLDDLLVVRYLGDSTARARALFTSAWRLLRPAVLGLQPVAPRIWST